MRKAKVDKKYTILAFFVLVLLAVVSDGLFIVRQTEYAVVFQFGEPIRVVSNVGLNVKLPFVQNVVLFDKRLQEISMEDKEVIASDQKRLIINAFVKYRIVEPIKYYTSVRDEYGFKNKFSTILDSRLRQVIGEIPLTSLLSTERANIMNKLQDAVSEKAKQFGVEVIDVRITRSDLPKANSNAIYKRMQSDREREAREIRAEGDEIAQKIRASTDKERSYLLAEARKNADTIVGDGEAAASKIYSRAYSKDPHFFEFYRTMQAYKASLNGGNSKIIISPNNDFLKYINKFDNN